MLRCPLALWEKASRKALFEHFIKVQLSHLLDVKPGGLNVAFYRISVAYEGGTSVWGVKKA